MEIDYEKLTAFINRANDAEYLAHSRQVNKVPNGPFDGIKLKPLPKLFRHIASGGIVGWKERNEALKK